jgi:hypothetical protein
MCESGFETAGEQHGMCESGFKMAGEQHGKCESALRVPWDIIMYVVTLWRLGLALQ